MSSSFKKSNIFFEAVTISVAALFLIIIISIFFITTRTTYKPIIDQLNKTNHSERAIQMMNERYTNVGSTWDNVFMMIFIGMWLSALVGAYMIDTHPIFAIILLLLIVPSLIVAMTMGNVYEEYVADADMQDFVANFPKSNYIMQNWLIIGICFFASVGGVLYAKNKYLS